MQDIDGDDRTLEDLLKGVALGIDYYQREYKWERKQLRELIDDLYGQFKQTWSSSKPDISLEEQSKYFLGSIVVSKSGDVRNLVDGQQRITTLTLILIYLNHLQKDHTKKLEKVRALIYDEEPSGYKFKLDIPERNACMEALLQGKTYNPEGKPDSVKNLIDRYNDIIEIFSEIDMKEDELHMFIWWIIRNVKIIEIVARDDGDAYTIFETMNDRGLSLSPTDMLRGYLLAGIEDYKSRQDADKTMKKYLQRFGEYGKNTAADFFRAWLRSQYAEKIRERNKDAEPQDFDKIGTEYHRWVRNNLKLENGNEFHKFITQNMSFFAELYVKILNAAATLEKGLESIKYNSDSGFSQHHVYLAGVSPEDNADTAIEKIRVVADYIDIWLNRRIWNYKSNGYSTIVYAIFLLTLEIRHKSLAELKPILQSRLEAETDDMTFDTPVQLNRHTYSSIHRQLARIIDWLERQSDLPGRYEDYIVRSGKNAFQVEHIWANNYERFSNEFGQQNDFDHHRNQIGGLLLLPRKVNASLGDNPYEEKLDEYAQQDILAKSLHRNSYHNNPAFLNMIKRYDLQFRCHDCFTKNDLLDRSRLYCEIAKLIWSDNRIIK